MIDQSDQPTPPAEGEVGELVRRLRYAKQNGNSIPSGIHWGLDDGTEHQGSIYVGSDHAADCSRAADLLEQRHPAPVPVPVSERLPEPKDCDAEGRCWIYMPDIGTAPSWRLVNPRDIGPYHTHWLPAHALPLIRVCHEGDW